MIKQSLQYFQQQKLQQLAIKLLPTGRCQNKYITESGNPLQKQDKKASFHLQQGVSNTEPLRGLPFAQFLETYMIPITFHDLIITVQQKRT